MFVIQPPMTNSTTSTNQKQIENSPQLNDTKIIQPNTQQVPVSPTQNPRSLVKGSKKVNSNSVTDIDVQQNPTLILEEINGDLLNNKEILINAAGLTTGGLRKTKDGITNFGPISEQNGVVINDYIIHLPGNLNEVIQTLFSVNFNLEEKMYYLCPGVVGNYGDATIFMKIDSKLKIDKKLFLSLGEVHFSVETKDAINHKIEIEITYDSNTTKKYEFDKDKKIITLGRGKKCDILLYHLSYSRIQTTFWFDEKEQEWFLQDGNEEKKSTNGTWAFLNWNWKIEEDIQFRIGQNLLKISIKH